MRVRGGVVLLALTAVLVGCTDDEPPSSLPPLPSAATPSATSSPAVMPLAAKAETAAGAAEFVRHYMAVLQAALAEGDSSSLMLLSTEDCEGCKNLLSAVAEVERSKQTIEGAPLRVLFAEVPALGSGPVVVDLRYERGSGRLLAHDGSVVSLISPEPPLDAQVRLVRTRHHWLVAGFSSRPPL